MSVAMILANSHSSVRPGLMDKSMAFFITSIIMAVITVVLTTMLLFLFDEHEKPTKYDVAIAWLPVILVDAAITQFLVGIMVWFAAMYDSCYPIIACQLGVLIVCCTVIALWLKERQVHRVEAQ